LSCSSPAGSGKEDKKNYLFVLTKILMWDSMGLLKQKRNIKCLEVTQFGTRSQLASTAVVRATV
jgi:hypothetical protein